MGAFLQNAYRLNLSLDWLLSGTGEPFRPQQNVTYLCHHQGK